MLKYNKKCKYILMNSIRQGSTMALRASPAQLWAPKPFISFPADFPSPDGTRPLAEAMLPAKLDSNPIADKCLCKQTTLYKICISYVITKIGQINLTRSRGIWGVNSDTCTYQSRSSVWIIWQKPQICPIIAYRYRDEYSTHRVVGV